MASRVGELALRLSRALDCIDYNTAPHCSFGRARRPVLPYSLLAPRFKSLVGQMQDEGSPCSCTDTPSSLVSAA